MHTHGHRKIRRHRGKQKDADTRSHADPGSSERKGDMERKREVLIEIETDGQTETERDRKRQRECGRERPVFRITRGQRLLYFLDGLFIKASGDCRLNAHCGAISTKQGYSTGPT